MDSVMVFQVLLRGKALPACFTHKRPFPCSKGKKENSTNIVFENAIKYHTQKTECY